MEISKIKEEARKALTNKWGKGALIVLAYLAILFIIELIGGMFEEKSTINYLISIAKTIMVVPLSFGVTYSFIRLKRGEEVKAFDFINSGFSNFRRAWKISLRITLKMIVVITIMVVIFIVTGDIANDYFISDRMTRMSFGLLMIIILFVTMWFVLIIRALLYSLTTYIAFDNPNMTALEVVNESERLMKGNRLKLFLLILSFIGWEILCAFTLGIGFLWLIPYVQVAGLCFYENVK